MIFQFPGEGRGPASAAAKGWTPAFAGEQGR